MDELPDEPENTTDNGSDSDLVVEEADDFDTWDLLDAVDRFDEMRDHLNDRTESRPPLMRDQLLALHQMAMNAYPGGPKEELVKLYDAAENLESIAFDLMSQAEQIHTTLQKLTSTEPEDLRGY